jgi:bifunctional DNA-binding transcriptional regulator/antitoxin component of YhaV-PrlF toxin-antitoxin module
MSLELTVTAKGQITLRQSVLEHLHVRPGDKVNVALLPDGKVEMRAASAGHDPSRARGMLWRPGQRPVSLEEMQDAIERGPFSFEELVAPGKASPRR